MPLTLPSPLDGGEGGGEQVRPEGPAGGEPPGGGRGWRGASTPRGPGRRQTALVREWAGDRERGAPGRAAAVLRDVAPPDRSRPAAPPFQPPLCLRIAAQ